MSYIGTSGRDTPPNCWQDAMRRMEEASRARPVGAEEHVDHLEQAGRQTESLFQTIVERAPDAIVAVGCDGRIKLVNQQTEKLFGFARRTLLGWPVELLLPERFGTLHQHHRAEYVTHPRTRPMGSDLELWGRRQDGSEFPVEVSLSPLPVGDSELLIIAIVRDISERKRLEAVERAAHAAAEQRQALLQTVLDQLPGGAYLVRGHDAALVMANRAATAVWGAVWPVGQPMADFLCASDVSFSTDSGQPLTVDELVTLQVVRGGPPLRQQREVVRHPDGRRLPILLSAVALDAALLETPLETPPNTRWQMRSAALHAGGTAWQSASLTPTATLSTLPHPAQPAGRAAEPAQPEQPVGLTDLAEQAEPGERAALILLQDITLLQAIEQLKDEFISLATHELRQPLAVIQGFASMLRVQTARGHGAPLDVWQQEAIGELESAAARLNELTNDLLDVTRIQAGRLQLQLAPQDLVALARRCLAQLQLTTDKHTLTLEAPPVPVVLSADGLRLGQVLGNLVGNAIKYSPQGGPITVSVRANPSAGRAEVRIRDQGIGIPTNEHGRLFQRFARASNVHDHGIPGSGLGLFVCRELVERHGGQIWFESTAGEGTTFSLTFPLAAAPEVAVDNAEGETLEARAEEAGRPVADTGEQASEDTLQDGEDGEDAAEGEAR